MLYCYRLSGKSTAQMMMLQESQRSTHFSHPAPLYPDLKNLLISPEAYSLISQTFGKRALEPPPLEKVRLGVLPGITFYDSGGVTTV